MQIHTQITPPELIKLFDFLDSETPATREWVTAYFIKQGLHFNLPATPYATLSMQASQFSAAAFQGEVKGFAQKMRSAFRVRKHREDMVTLSISLDKATADKLSQMSKGRNKTKVVTQLIDNNYHLFLASEKERRFQLAEAKKQREYEKLQKQPIRSVSTKLQINSNDESVTNELHDGIAALYDIIFTMNESERKIDDQILLQATKIYYAAFAK
ncbi:MAG: hypothetical protein KKE30_06280 [Gammaproteobacteria bacterium]|nr:hypothetical protein [Gammaproteobacteria bacterium]